MKGDLIEDHYEQRNRTEDRQTLYEQIEPRDRKENYRQFQCVHDRLLLLALYKNK